MVESDFVDSIVSLILAILLMKKSLKEFCIAGQEVYLTVFFCKMYLIYSIFFKVCNVL